MRGERRGVSAAVLLAFLFQLLLPLAAHAVTLSPEDDLDRALRASICGSLPAKSHEAPADEGQADCADWCVLCALPATAAPQVLKAALFVAARAAETRIEWPSAVYIPAGIDDQNVIPPRAPPFS